MGGLCRLSPLRHIFGIAAAALLITLSGARADDFTLMSAVPSSRQANSWLPSKRLSQAVPGRAGGAVVETTVDHTLMRGSEPHDR